MRVAGRKRCQSCRDASAQRRALTDRAAKRAWYEKRRWYWTFRKFGITEAEYRERLAQQGGRCAICGSDDPRSKRTRLFCVDHDHSTGKVRGLLCVSCNAMLGAINDSVERLQAGIEYLRAHEQQEKVR